MTSATTQDHPERRTNRLLRLLVDEMLEQVRELQRHAGPWPPEERAAAEEALARIMSQVRQAAISGEAKESP